MSWPLAYTTFVCDTVHTSNLNVLLSPITVLHEYYTIMDLLQDDWLCNNSRGGCRLVMVKGGRLRLVPRLRRRVGTTRIWWRICNIKINENFHVLQYSQIALIIRANLRNPPRSRSSYRAPSQLGILGTRVSVMVV